MLLLMIRYYPLLMGIFLKKDNFWNLLLEYRWFYTYFKQKRYKRKG